MVRVASTSSDEVTRYGPLLAVQTVSLTISLRTSTTELSSYQISIVLRSNSTPCESKDCTSTRLMPGVSGTLPTSQAPRQAIQLAKEPFTRTERVRMALANPLSDTVGTVLRG